MIRKAFVMAVNQGMEAEYERRHDELWPEMATTLRLHGVVGYSIFRHRETNQLFGYVELADDHRWEAVADTAVCRRWWTFMADLMPTNADGSPRSTDLDEVFSLTSP